MSLLASQKQAFGLEISDSSIKAVQLKKTGSIFSLIGYAITKIPNNLVSAGEIKNKDEIVKYIQSLLSSSKPKKITTPYVVCSLPENKTFVRIINIPKIPLEEIKEAIKWEAEQYIPLPIDSVYLDWQIIEEFDNKQRILVAASPKNLSDSYVDILLKAKLKPIVFDLEEAAQSRALISPKQNKIANLIVDIGASKTVFIVNDNQIIPFASNTKDICGNNFTSVISKSLKISLEAADNKKIACASQQFTEEEEKILALLYPQYDMISQKIEQIINYFHNHFPKNNKIQQIILCGGSSGFYNLPQYISQKTKLKVILGNPLINLPSNKPFSINNYELLSISNAMGLAIRGASLKDYQK